jgi:hypothetical protein
MTRTASRVIVCAAGLALVPAHAFAQGTPAPAGSAVAPPTAPAADLDRAKDLFRKGVELMKAGDLERALDHFLRSRVVVPSVPNTMNAAICLDRLERADEALDLYEQLLTELGPKLEEDDRRSVSQAMTALRRRVGSVDVSANVDGTLVIDGRKRGMLPLTGPVRVLPGKHVVRVLKDGYAPAEARTEVKVGESALVDLKLEPLTASGRLSIIDDAAAAGLEVLVDGAPVGVAPWEGVLAPGRHLVALRGKDSGTAPVSATVLLGQTVAVHVRSQPIGQPIRLETDPPDASLTLDGVSLGKGAWQGRLPLGAHLVEAAEEGYVTEHAHLDGSARGTITIKLPVDGKHPRWRAANESKIRIEAHGGYLFGGTLGGTAESSCPDACTNRSKPSGVLVGVRGGYVLPSGLVPEIGVGYLSVSTSLVRTVGPVPADDYSYRMADSITVSGPYASAGIGWNVGLGSTVELEPRLTLGAFFARSRDSIDGQLVRSGEPSVPVDVASNGQGVRGLDFFAKPEVAARAKVGAFHVGLGFGAAIFLVDGPALPHGDTSVSASAIDTTPPAPGKPIPLGALRATSQVAGETAYRRFVLWSPEIGVGYTF